MLRILIRVILRYFPWILLITFLSWMWISGDVPFLGKNKKPGLTVNNDIILQQLEAIGKLELIKYHFKEITEVKATSQWKAFFNSYSPDMKAALITSGVAVGCLDLTLLTKEDIVLKEDEILVYLPNPELCQYKVDLEKSRIYHLETGILATDTEEKKFIETVYSQAEHQIKKAAYASGILDKTKENADTIIKPLIEKITNKKVKLVFGMNTQKIDAIR